MIIAWKLDLTIDSAAALANEFKRLLLPIKSKIYCSGKKYIGNVCTKIKKFLETQLSFYQIYISPDYHLASPDYHMITTWHIRSGCTRLQQPIWWPGCWRNSWFNVGAVGRTARLREWQFSHQIVTWHIRYGCFGPNQPICWSGCWQNSWFNARAGGRTAHLSGWQFSHLIVTWHRKDGCSRPDQPICWSGWWQNCPFT